MPAGGRRVASEPSSSRAAGAPAAAGTEVFADCIVHDKNGRSQRGGKNSGFGFSDAPDAPIAVVAHETPNRPAAQAPRRRRVIPPPARRARPIDLAGGEAR
jgi:hypothetical protein